MELADRNLWDCYKESRGQGHQGIPRDELLRYMEEEQLGPLAQEAYQQMLAADASTPAPTSALPG
jgi:eukaryotic-like serine/threonine-protein kinase